MPDARTIQEQIHARLVELEEVMAPLRVEAAQLQAMAAAFAETAEVDIASEPPKRRSTTRPSTPAATRRRTAAAGRGRRPPRQGNRASEALAQIVKRPGSTIAEIAKSIGISPNYLYRVLPRLEEEGKITRRGKGYHPIGAADKTAPSNGQPVT